MCCIDAIRSNVFEFEGKIGKDLTSEDIQRDGILPNSQLLKPPIDVFALHESFIS